MTDDSERNSELPRRSFLGALGATGAMGSAAGSLANNVASGGDLQAGGLATALEEQYLRDEYVTAPSAAFDPSGLEPGTFVVLSDTAEMGVWDGESMTWFEELGGGGGSLWQQTSEGDAIEPTTGDKAISVDQAHINDIASIDKVETRSLINSQSRTREMWTHRGELLSSLADESEWSIATDPAEFTSEETFGGTQSLRMEEGSQARYHFSDPENLSGYNIAIACKLDHSTNGGKEVEGAVRIDFVDESDNRRRHDAQLSDRNFGDDWWMLDVIYHSEDSGFDITAVDYVEVRAPSRDSHLFWLANLRLIPKSDQSYVMVGFDDVWERDRTAFEIFNNYGIPLYFAVNGGFVDGGASHEPDWERETMENMEWMYDRGAVYLNHAHEHENPHDDGIEAFEEGVRNTAIWLEKHGFKKGSNIFVWPGGDPSPEAVEVVERYCDLALGYGTGTSERAGVPLYTTQPWMTTRYGFDNGIETAKEVVDKAEAGHIDVAEMFGHSHNLGPTEWEELAQYISQADVIPITPVEFLEENRGLGMY